MRQNPVNEICAYLAASFLGTAWQAQLFAPPFSEYGDGGFAGILGAVTCHIVSGDQIDPAAERLHGNIFKNLIIVRVEPDRAADDRPAGHGFERAHTADGAVAQRLRAGLSEKRTFQRFPGFLRLRRLIVWAVAEKLCDVASHAPLPARPQEQRRALQDERVFAARWLLPSERGRRCRPVRIAIRGDREICRCRGMIESVPPPAL